MITIEEVEDSHGGPTKKAFICPSCKSTIIFWAYAIMRCRECGKEIPNVYSIHAFEGTRLQYHFRKRWANI